MLLDSISKDYEWFDNDPVSYEAERFRQEEEYKKQLAEHMGEKFCTMYKSTRHELESEVNYRTDRIKKLVELRAPDEIAKYEQDKLGELLMDLKNGNYIVTPEEEEYRELYEERKSTFEFNFELRVPDVYK